MIWNETPNIKEVIKAIEAKKQTDQSIILMLDNYG